MGWLDGRARSSGCSLSASHCSRMNTSRNPHISCRFRADLFCPCISLISGILLYLSLHSCSLSPRVESKVLTRSSQLNNAPGPHTLQFFLDLPQFRKDPLGGFFRAALTYGDVVRYRGVWVTHQLSHPDHIQQVLQSNVANYRKGRGYKILKLSLGEGLLTSEGLCGSGNAR